MAAKKQIPLTDRTIPGITWKQVVAFVVVIGTAVWIYFRLETIAKDSLRQSRDNGIVLIGQGILLKEMQAERKELIRINDARLNLIELQLAEQRIRITNLELKIIK